MTFVWTDRNGRRHELDAPALIEAEAEALAQEKDRYIDMVDNPDPMIRDPARAAIRKLGPEFKRVSDDLARWNDYAVEVTRAEAAKLVEQIDRLPTLLAEVLLVVELHSEHDRMIAVTTGAPETRARILSSPATPLQHRAIAACRSLDAPPDAATREDVKAWLDAQPRFARRSHADDGWFTWFDREGHAHQLMDQLAMEGEIAVIVGELTDLRRKLICASAPDDLYAALNSGFALLERLQILKGDFERFSRAELAREDAAWSNYAADWRSKRKKS